MAMLCPPHWRHKNEISELEGHKRERCIRCGKINPLGVPPSIRFWDHVNKNGPIPGRRPDLGPCWLWTGLIPSNGYGIMTIKDSEGVKHSALVHRYAWELAHGPIPGALEPDHLCGVRHCVRDSHLEVVTHQENIRRALSKPVCKRGHPQTPGNKYHYKANGIPKQRCKLCMPIQMKAWREKVNPQEPRKDVQ